jgi:hypothetical protein
MDFVYVVRATTNLDSYLLGVYPSQGEANARIKDVLSWDEQFGIEFKKIWSELVSMKDGGNAFSSNMK